MCLWIYDAQHLMICSLVTERRLKYVKKCKMFPVEKKFSH
jgi:hypothetical protein